MNELPMWNVCVKNVTINSKIGLKSMEDLKITNICGWRQPDLKCGYYPCSDGSPCGHCWALTDPNGCNRTKARDEYLESIRQRIATFIALQHEGKEINLNCLERNKNLYAQLCRELEVEAELTKPWRLDGK